MIQRVTIKNLLFSDRFRYKRKSIIIETELETNL